MNKRDDRLHLKLYITIIFCVIIAIFINSSILYVNFQSILMKHEYKAKLEKMESDAEHISMLSDIALSSVFQIYNDISVKKLYTYGDIDAFEENAALLQMRSFLVTIPYVDSIYVYNVNNNRIYIVTNENDLVRPWSSDHYKKDNYFYDKSAIEMIDNCTDYLPYIPVPRYYQVNDGITKGVYTYIMYDTFNASKKNNVVMLNLESRYLFQEENNDKLRSISLVIDKDNNIVYSNNEEFHVKDQLLLDFDQTGMMNEEDSGYFLTEINNTKSVVIYTGADEHQWRYISIIEYNALVAQVRKLQAITVFISILIAFICVLAAHIYSRSLTVSVHTMAMKIKKLQDEKRRSENMARNRKLFDLLYSSGMDNEGKVITGLDYLSQIGLVFKERRKLILLCLRIYGDKGDQSLLESLNIQDRKAFKSAAVKRLTEMFGNRIESYDLALSNDRSLIFMNANEDVSKGLLEMTIKQMQLYMKEHFSVSVPVIVSVPENNPNNLYYLYERIEETASRSIFWGKDYITFVPEKELKSVNDYQYPDHKEKHLVECLMLGKADEARTIYNDIMAETYQYPIIIYNMVINRIIFAVNNVVNLIKKHSATQTFGGFTVLSNILQEFDTLEKRNNKFFEIFLQIQIEIENKKSEKQNQVIANINQLIDSKFEDPDFSLDFLADMIGISTAHMCRIYKQYTGNTINDIIAEKRMDQARRLLTDTNMSVGEIAEKVGYINPSYFYRVFKKANGVTPNEYRKKK